MKPTIRFESRFVSPGSRGCEVVATVWPVVQDEDGSALDDAVVKSQAVFIGTSSSEAQSSVQVPQAGTYLVDVAFPSGQRSRRTISVSEFEPFRFLLNDKSLASRTPPSEAPTGIAPTIIAAVKTALGGCDLDIRHLKLADVRSLAPLDCLPELLDKLTTSFPDGESIERIGAAELKYEKFLSSTTGNLVNAEYRRSWIMVTGPGKAQTLIAYPHEWHIPGISEQAFRLVVERKSTRASRVDAKWMTHLGLCDSYYGSVIEYLNRRDTRGQKAMMSSLRAPTDEMLYGKVENPFAAAAGAYMLALGNQPTADQLAFMKNLCNWFPWLPDGPIALGWQTLRTEDSRSPTWKAAEALFMDAFDRGLPYYSVGLRILVDALTLLSMATPESSRLKAMLATVTAIDLASVKTEPFTTLQIWRYQRLQRSA